MGDALCFVKRPTCFVESQCSLTLLVFTLKIVLKLFLSTKVTALPETKGIYSNLCYVLSHHKQDKSATKQ